MFLFFCAFVVVLFVLGVLGFFLCAFVVVLCVCFGRVEFVFCVFVVVLLLSLLLLFLGEFWLLFFIFVCWGVIGDFTH